MTEPNPHKGWHSRGYLPHFDAANVIQSVIFRLADSLPSYVLDQAPDPRGRRKMADATLDAGMGACALREARVAGLVQAALLYFDGGRYRMLAWCIMPNHVHALIEPLEGNGLSAIVQSWKSFTAKRANAILEREGSFWAPDYFDRYIRDQGHFETSIHYIEHNPVKAGLAHDADEWLWSSAGRRGFGRTPGT
ncbi:transposase [Reyranella sp. CPCC 100927]|uniref:REP-associated tyrosine transposase n=1 Tax=Reyranella sp. CPCC 100927 TaxID=2599616 RepID=UPI0011B713B1|nr:transposase [Reyranella sp. CPCC 100927]TWT03969.1 transposase [Reyranella sp. CPCC 100927]